MAISKEIRSDELKVFCDLMREEAAASIALTEMLFEKQKVSIVRKQLVRTIS
jgi:hypothetical protein